MKEIKLNLIDAILAISVIVLVAVGGYWLYNKSKNIGVYSGATPPDAPNSYGTPGQLPKPITGQ